eukprot:scaffold127242_cov25-Tisochrysis_lutea.AAC.5
MERISRARARERKGYSNVGVGDPTSLLSQNMAIIKVDWPPPWGNSPRSPRRREREKPRERERS